MCSHLFKPAVTADRVACSCGETDLAKERGPILEEWRMNRSAQGRAGEAHWELLMRGSKFAERLPIGLESVIKGVPAADVKAFYSKWYHPQFMAVVAVGDFAVRPHAPP